MTLALPASPEALAKATWNDIRPYFDALAARELDHGNVEQWLADWSRLEELLTEAASRAMIRYTVDTRDPEAEADHLRFSTEILPQAEERSVALQKRLVASGYSSPALETTLRALPDVDRDLPRGERADHERAGGARPRTSASPAA